MQSMFPMLYLHSLSDDALVDCGSFEAMMLRRLSLVTESEDIRFIFRAFDTKFSGTLRVDDALAAFARSMPSVSPQVVMEIFAEADTDGDGLVTLTDFERILTAAGKL
eukprot:TRINITY_DN3498_c0_g1_i3.p3 TRINITY_DN3498_c0_g1~~TRINITY_DN3498_c0_g1_i3.p3  ORF type:complete len:108 (+),score=29.71 TRINITY_DN3498_c0_g1_i3:240-563(+)